MSNQEFDRERMYWISRSIVKSMREKGVVTVEEYGRMDRILLERYRPILGMLLAGEALNLERS